MYRACMGAYKQLQDTNTAMATRSVYTICSMRTCSTDHKENNNSLTVMTPNLASFLGSTTQHSSIGVWHQCKTELINVHSDTVEA